MASIDDIIDAIVNKKCPMEDMYDDISKVEVNDKTISKIEDIIGLMRFHEENIIKIRRSIQLRTREYYVKKLLNDEASHQVT